MLAAMVLAQLTVLEAHASRLEMQPPVVSLANGGDRDYEIGMVDQLDGVLRFEGRRTSGTVEFDSTLRIEFDVPVSQATGWAKQSSDVWSVTLDGSNAVLVSLTVYGTPEGFQPCSGIFVVDVILGAIPSTVVFDRDDIAIGPRAAQFVAAPEPSTSVLTALGLALLAVRSSRDRSSRDRSSRRAQRPT